MLNTPSSAASYVRKHPDTGMVPLDCVLPSESIAFVLPDTTYSVPTCHTAPSPVVSASVTVAVFQPPFASLASACAVSPLAVVVAATIAAASHAALTVVSSPSPPVEPESGSVTAGTTSAFTVESFTVIPDIMFCILSVQLLTESHVVPWNTMSLQYCILFHVLSVFLSTAFFA